MKLTSTSRLLKLLSRKLTYLSKKSPTSKHRKSLAKNSKKSTSRWRRNWQSSKGPLLPPRVLSRKIHLKIDKCFSRLKSSRKSSQKLQLRERTCRKLYSLPFLNQFRLRLKYLQSQQLKRKFKYKWRLYKLLSLSPKKKQFQSQVNKKSTCLLKIFQARQTEAFQLQWCEGTPLPTFQFSKQYNRQRRNPVKLTKMNMKAKMTVTRIQTTSEKVGERRF